MKLDVFYALVILQRSTIIHDVYETLKHLAVHILVEWLSNLFVTERTKVSNFYTSSISMYSVRKISAPKKMADVPRITAV